MQLGDHEIRYNVNHLCNVKPLKCKANYKKKKKKENQSKNFKKCFKNKTTEVALQHHQHSLYTKTVPTTTQSLPFENQ